MLRTPIAFAHLPNFLGAIFLALLIGAVLILPLVGCSAPSGGTYAVANVNIDGVGDARFDGNVFVGHGMVGLRALVFVKGLGMPLYGPVTLSESTRLVVRVDPEFRGEFELDQPIPPWCAELYLPGEAEALGISFGD